MRVAASPPAGFPGLRRRAFAATGSHPGYHASSDAILGASLALRIGTRGSPLALAQAREVRARLAAALGWSADRITIEPIRTTGDMIRDRPLSEAGGKGLFTKEIEEALLAGAVDLAVHSAKDMPTLLPAGLMIAAVLPREDARDVFISRKAGALGDLPAGATVGTASLRRQALVKHRRRDLAVVPLRGNVETRLRKLEAGEVDATVLALAGLRRLGLAAAATAVLAVDEFLPAVGQGVIAIEARAGDARVCQLLDAVNHADTAIALAAERAFLAELDGSCRTPIAGHATVSAGRIAVSRIDRQAGRQRALRMRRVRASPPRRWRSVPTPAASSSSAPAPVSFPFPPPQAAEGEGGVRGAAPDHAAAAGRRAHRGGAAARGHDVVIAPLLAVEAVDFELPQRRYAAVVMTSANAARAVSRHPRLAQLCRCRCSPSGGTPLRRRAPPDLAMCMRRRRQGRP